MKLVITAMTLAIIFTEAYEHQGYQIEEKEESRMDITSRERERKKVKDNSTKSWVKKKDWIAWARKAVT